MNFEHDIIPLPYQAALKHARGISEIDAVMMKIDADHKGFFHEDAFLRIRERVIDGKRTQVFVDIRDEKAR